VRRPARSQLTPCERAQTEDGLARRRDDQRPTSEWKSKGRGPGELAMVGSARDFVYKLQLVAQLKSRRAA
jgi:hypothetical protein